MKTPWVRLAVVAFALFAAGCGGVGGEGGPPLPIPFVEEIPSDARVDGDIDAQGTVTVGAGTVLAGVDPVDALEFRGFFSFPLVSIPADAAVQDAFLELSIVDLAPAVPTTFTIDLVSFGPPLISSDFGTAALPPIRSGSVTFFPADIGRIVLLDVTTLVQEAFFQNLADAQFRLRLDAAFPVGLLTIDDPVSTLVGVPLLTVEFF